MNFFGKNIEQDKSFVDINNRLCLCYWMASDIEHFVENSPELINKDVLKKIYNNSNILNHFFEETKKDMDRLGGIHKECALLIFEFVKVCIEEFECVQRRSSQDEPEDSKLSRIIDMDINLRNQLTKKYLFNTDVEYYRNMAFKYYAKSLWGLTDFFSYHCQKDDQDLAKSALDFTLHNLNRAEAEIMLGTRFLEHGDISMKEFRIAIKDSLNISPQLSEKYAKDYYALQIDFNHILKELFFVTKEYYAQYNDNQESSDAELKLFIHESNQYLAKLNQVGIEISNLILSAMNIDIPDYEPLSELTIKSHLDLMRTS